MNEALSGEVGYKKVCDGAVLELAILGPSEEGRFGLGYCTSAVRVLGAWCKGVYTTTGTYRSMREASLVYKVGEIVRAPSFDVCGSEGIYYFTTRGEATRY